MKEVTKQDFLSGKSFKLKGTEQRMQFVPNPKGDIEGQLAVSGPFGIHSMNVFKLGSRSLEATEVILNREILFKLRFDELEFDK